MNSYYVSAPPVVPALTLDGARALRKHCYCGPWEASIDEERCTCEIRNAQLNAARVAYIYWHFVVFFFGFVSFVHCTTYVFHNFQPQIAETCLVFLRAEHDMCYFARAARLW